MQTGLVIQQQRAQSPEHRRRQDPVRRVVEYVRHWAASYDLGSAEKIRRVTGAR
jgi:hypothetical protein